MSDSGLDVQAMIDESVLISWEFLQGCMGFKDSDAFDAQALLSTSPEIGGVEEVEDAGVVTLYLDRGDALAMTIWWTSSDKAFRLGVVGDYEGSIT